MEDDTETLDPSVPFRGLHGGILRGGDNGEFDGKENGS